MKLPDLLSKLKNARLMSSGFRLPDMDRAGDALIALSLAVALTCACLVALYGAGDAPAWLHGLR